MTQNKKPSHSSGNAMIYVLIALALFGALTFTLSSQNNQADGQDIDDETAALYANELLEYVASAQQVINMMISSGSEINDLSFLNPASAGFETGSHIHKVFHPQGGGLNYQSKYKDSIAASGGGAWYIQNNLHVEWTETPANDIMIMAYNINPSICANLNEKFIGSPAIPAATVDLDDIFNPDSFTEASFNSTNCPGCDGLPILCVSNAAVDQYGFYNIIAGQ